MKIVKYLAYALAAVLLLLVLAAVALLVWFNPNDYKTDLARLVRERTGRELTLQGDLKLSLYPWVAVELGQASLGNAQGFGSAPMLELAHARLGVKLMPLLHKQVEIGSVELDGLKAHLAVDRQGRDNWSDLLKSGKQQPETRQAASKVSASVASVRLRDAVFSYDDAGSDTHLAVSGLSLDTGRLEPGQPFALDTAFDFASGKTLKAHVGIQGTASADTDTQRYTLGKPSITALVQGAGLPKGGSEISLRASNLSLDLDRQTLDLPDMQLEALGAELSGALKGEKIVDAPSFSGPIRVASLDPRALLGKLDIALPETTDAKALRTLELSGQVRASSSALNLSALKMRLDDSNFSGSAGIADFDTLALRFDLSVDRIDIDRYLPPAEAPPAGAPAASGPLFSLPVELLRSLNARGNLAIGEASFAKVQYQQLRVGVNAGGGRLRLNPLAARMYGGQYQGDIGVDVSGRQPRLTLDEHVSGIDFAALFKDLFDTGRISGRGNANVKASATGGDSDQLLATLTGDVDVHADDGAFDKLDLWYEILRARALLKKQPIPERTGPERTSFTQLGASGKLVNGVLNIAEASATTARLAVRGSGTADVARNAIDMRLTAGVQQFAAGSPEAEEVGDLAGLSVPIVISGTLTDPKIRPDVAGLLKARVQQEIDKKKQEVQQQAQDKLQEQLQQQKDKLQEKLKGLFGK